MEIKIINSIYLDDIKKGRFDNEKEELYVIFKDGNKNEYKWRPRWIRRCHKIGWQVKQKI